MKAALKEIFTSELGIKPEDFHDGLTYNSIPEWDSASHMSMILAVEEKFGLALESDDIVNMTNIEKIVDILKAKGVPVE
ncbi:MAG TPA: acyl carrier protein [Rhizomicrobium sp.]|jgi:acyl carrier protein